MLGVAVANEHIREGSVSPQLEDHLDLFDMMRKEDEITLQGFVSLPRSLQSILPKFLA